MTNAIRPGVAVSWLANGETQTRESGKPSTLRGSVSKQCWGASGGWRRNDGKVEYMNQGDLSGVRRCSCWLTSRRAARSGVRAAIVVMKPGNSGGAKGRRKVDA
jgi:hypothetical protein